MRIARRIRWFVDRSLVRDGFSGSLTTSHHLLACIPTALALFVIFVTGLSQTGWVSYAIFFLAWEYLR
jgi:hypothetical protein